MVSFEIFVKAMPPSLSELKVLPSFCFAFKIPDDRAVTNAYVVSCQPRSKNLERYLLFTYLAIVISYGTVVTDFDWEAKTRCNF